MPEDLVRWKAVLLEAGLRTKTIRDSKIAPLRAILQRGVDNRKIRGADAISTRLARRENGMRKSGDRGNCSGRRHLAAREPVFHRFALLPERAPARDRVAWHQ
jgi:hypothetical protein